MSERAGKSNGYRKSGEERVIDGERDERDKKYNCGHYLFSTYDRFRLIIE